MRAIADCFLYAFIDTAYLRGRSPESLAFALTHGGADIIQLRAKDLPGSEVRRLAARVLSITRAAGVPLVINDHPEVARELGAEMCHLGQEDFFDAGYNHVSDVRGGCPELAVGLSSHSPDQARRAMAAGADYLGVGPVFQTATKPGAVPVSLDYVRWAAANVPVPWFAIGGVNLSTLPAVLEAGAQRVCVVSAILDTPDPAAACGQFKQALLARR